MDKLPKINKIYLLAASLIIVLLVFTYLSLLKTQKTQRAASAKNTINSNSNFSQSEGCKVTTFAQIVDDKNQPIPEPYLEQMLRYRPLHIDCTGKKCLDKFIQGYRSNQYFTSNADVKGVGPYRIGDEVVWTISHDNFYDRNNNLYSLAGNNVRVCDFDREKSTNCTNKKDHYRQAKGSDATNTNAITLECDKKIIVGWVFKKVPIASDSLSSCSTPATGDYAELYTSVSVGSDGTRTPSGACMRINFNKFRESGYWENRFSLKDTLTEFGVGPNDIEYEKICVDGQERGPTGMEYVAFLRDVDVGSGSGYTGWPIFDFPNSSPDCRHIDLGDSNGELYQPELVNAADEVAIQVVPLPIIPLSGISKDKKYDNKDVQRLDMTCKQIQPLLEN